MYTTNRFSIKNVIEKRIPEKEIKLPQDIHDIIEKKIEERKEFRKIKDENKKNKLCARTLGARSRGYSFLFIGLLGMLQCSVSISLV